MEFKYEIRIRIFPALFVVVRYGLANYLVNDFNTFERSKKVIFKKVVIPCV